MEHTTTIAGEILGLVAAGALGLFAGAMLTEGLVLVPYWRSLETRAFYAWYRENAARLVGFFGPLTWIAAIAALVAAWTLLSTRAPGRIAAAGAALLCLAAVATFPIYFSRANARFFAGRLSADELREELARWARWHTVRIGLSVASLGFALAAL